MIGIQVHIGPGDEAGLAYEVDSLRVLEPLIVGTGVATAEEIGIETFEQRLREDREKARAVGCIPLALSVWATTGVTVALGNYRRNPSSVRPRRHRIPAGRPAWYRRKVTISAIRKRRPAAEAGRHGPG
jgi:hypothetical protein